MFQVKQVRFMSCPEFLVSDGAGRDTLFSGPDAEQRARSYADSLNQAAAPAPDAPEVPEVRQ